jgi:peptidoglycan/xylan/chitin deacetylase (PgdA/CDA1 family)
MEQYSYRGTMFTNTGMVGSPRRLSWAQLDSLKHYYNWEIGGHTLHHEMLTQLSYQEAEANIAQDYNNLVQRNYRPKSFATTYGYCPVEYYKILKKYYKNVRTCLNTPMYVPVDRNLLGAYNVDNSMSASNIVSRITQGINEKQNLVILLFHEASTTDTAYFNNCHPDVFAETMKKFHKMGVKVLPLDEALDYLSD